MIRRSLQRSLAASRCIRRHVFVGYKLPPMPAKMEKPGENSWLQFFVSSRFEIEFDLDRTLLNLQEGEVDEYAVRFIMQNYEGFKSYQIVRALLFIRSYEIKSKMINRLLDLIVEGDKELYPQDLEVICLLKLPHFQLNPMLREFVIYNIAKHFSQQDLLVKSLCMGYLLRINKISDELLNAYLDSLEQAETSLDKPLTQLFSEWKLQHKLNFIFTLQFMELILKPHDKISLVRRIRNTCFESVRF